LLAYRIWENDMENQPFDIAHYQPEFFIERIAIGWILSEI
jgi:hypothetical protein